MSRFSEEKFYSRCILTPNGCLEWTGSKTKEGYGTVGIHNKVRKTHRIAWFLSYGEWPPDNLLVLHSCDNPPCVNVEHLFLGTNADNSADKIAKGRMRHLRGEELPHSVLNPNQVLEIRQMADNSSLSMPKIAKLYGISVGAVKSIKYRKSWGWLDDLVS